MAYNNDIIKKNKPKTILDLDQFAIWSSILGSYAEFNKFYRNPTRNDTNPKCKLWDKDGVIYLSDFASTKTHLNCVQAYMKLNNLDYGTAFKELLNNTKFSIQAIKTNSPRIVKEKLIYKPIFKKWSKKGLDYWNQYLINPKNYKVAEINGYTVNNEPVYLTRLAFVYDYNIEVEDNYYKFYLPGLNGLSKEFFGNITASSTWLWKENDKKEIIISKAAKEQMFFHSIFGNNFNYAHLQSENSFKSLLNKLTEFDTFYLNFDMDKAGLKGYENMSEFLKEKGKTVYPLISDKYKNFTDYPNIEDSVKELKLHFKL